MSWRWHRATLAVVALLGVVAGSSDAQARHAHHRATNKPNTVPGPTAADAWPELKGDLRPDPDTTFGVLPNGLRYAIKHNETPAREVSVRLRFAAGSLDETPDEAGYAHFIEHMTFRGSTHVPDGGAVKLIENLGISMEADANAFTTPQETFYSLDIPNNDAQTLDSVLMLLRETASEVTFDQKAIDSERQVVLAEKRMRDTPSLHVGQANEKLIFGEALGNALTPIGREEVLLTATTDKLKQFYERHYRPENATLIVVGDVDPHEVESKIRAHFEDWRGIGPAAQPHALPAPTSEGLKLSLLTEPGAPTAVLYSWPHPEPLGPDSLAQQKANMQVLVGLGILNQRLQDETRSRESRFVDARASRGGGYGQADIYLLNVTYGLGGPVPAIAGAQQILSGLLRNGVSQAEFDRQMGTYKTAFATLAASSKTTESPELASVLLNCVNEKEAFRTPAEEADVFNTIAKTMTADDVTRTMRSAFTGTGPYVVLSSPAPIRGGEAAIRTALTAAPADTPVALANDGDSVRAWPYTSFGTPAKVISRTDVADLGVTLVRFSNGTRAAIKKTQFQSSEVFIDVRFGHGRLGLPKDRVVASWALPDALIYGGLGRVSYEDLRKLYNTRIAEVQLAINDDAFRFVGRTRAEDLDASLQLIAAYMTDPGWRPEGLEQARNMELNRLTSGSTSPDGMLALTGTAIAHNSDFRWRIPPAGQISNLSRSDVKGVLASALASGAIDATVVGDVDIDAAINTLAATIGALPAHAPEIAGPGDERVAVPNARPMVLRHGGGSDQAAAAIMWPTSGFYADVQEQRDLFILQLVLQHRLFDELRTNEGLTYAPQATSEASLDTPSFGYISVSADVPPDKTQTFYDTVAKVVADLKASPVSPDELRRARDPHVGDVVREQETNEYWLTMLSGVQNDPRRLDVIRSTVPDLKAVTAQSVQRAAQTYLRDDTTWKVIVLPRDYAMKAYGSGG